MKSDSLKGGRTMKRNVFIYGSYLGLLGIITLAIQTFSLNPKIGLWIALFIATIYAILWPRW